MLYRDSGLRREALSPGSPPGSRYSLYGLDELRSAGFDVEHNLEPGHRPGRGSHAATRAVNAALGLVGGYGGDFASVLASRTALNRADVVFSTVDTVGIPVALLQHVGLVRPPVVYAAIGLPERLEQLRTRAARRLYERAYRRLHTIVAYNLQPPSMPRPKDYRCWCWIIVPTVARLVRRRVSRTISDFRPASPAPRSPAEP